MILDNPPNQIAWRGALRSGKHLELLEDQIREFHGSPHNYHCPMSGSLLELGRVPDFQDTWNFWEIRAYSRAARPTMIKWTDQPTWNAATNSTGGGECS